VKGLSRSCLIFLRLQSPDKNLEDLQEEWRLELRSDVAYIAQSLWELLIEGHRLKLSVWSSDCNLDHVNLSGEDSAFKCDIFHYELDKWAKVCVRTSTSYLQPLMTYRIWRQDPLRMASTSPFPIPGAS
jgi:hypothetical protein